MSSKYEKKVSSKPYCATNIVIPSSKIMIPTTNESSVCSTSSAKNGMHFNFSSKVKLADNRQKSEQNLLSMRVGSDLRIPSSKYRHEGKLHGSSSYKELTSNNELKKSHISGRNVTSRESPNNTGQVYDLKKSILEKSKGKVY